MTGATAIISASDEAKQAADPVPFPEEFAAAQTTIKAAQSLLKDIRSVFSKLAAAKKAAQPPKPKAAGKAKAKA